MLVALASSPYTLPKHLKGQKVAFGFVGSTSKHLGPIQVIADGGLNPRDDIHTKTSVAWEALKKGDMAAVGMNHLNFLSLRAKEMKKVAYNPGLGYWTGS